MIGTLIRQIWGKLTLYLRQLDPLQALLLFALSLVLCFAVLMIATKGKPSKRSMLLGLFAALYLTAIGAITVLGRAAGTVTVQPRFLESFARLPDTHSDLYFDALFNVVMFVPLGHLLSYRLRPVWTGLVVVLCTLAIEEIQKYTGRGLFSGWDIVLNTLGGVLGIGLFFLVQNRKKTARPRNVGAEQNRAGRNTLLNRNAPSAVKTKDMNKEEIVLLELLKASLFGVQASIPPDTDWDQVMREAGSQAVLGIAARAVPAEEYPRWKREERMAVVNSAQKLYAEQEMLRLFSTAGIPVVILKGSAAAVYYPEPSRRWMGDIDFIVPQDRFAEAKALLLASGYVLRDPDREETVREIAFFKNGIEFELHYRFSDPDLDIESYVTRGLKQPEYGTVYGNRFPMLPKLENGLVLLAHMRHHLQMGMGLRQVIDWMMYVDRELDDTFWQNSFSAAAKQTGLETLAAVTTHMCQRHLGLREDITWCKNADDTLCDALLALLLSSGNFGGKNGVGGRVEKIATTMRKEGFFRYIQQAGETNWDAYHRHPWLKPFCWLYQLFRYLKQRIGTRRKNTQVFDDLDRSRTRYALLKKLKII